MRHDLGALRIAEIEAVSDRERLGADRAEVAIRLGDRLFAALVRVGVAIARRAVGGDRERLLRAVDTHDRRVAAGRLDSVAAHFLVVLLPYPAPRRDVGRRHKLEQVRSDIGALGDVTERLDLRPRFILVAAHRGPVVKRGVIGEWPERNVGDGLAVMDQHHTARIGDLADHREVEFPFLEDGLREIFAAGFEHHEHALLALAQHHLIGGHAGFALRHRVHVQPDADAAFARHLDRGGRQPCRAHVLDRDDRV